MEEYAEEKENEECFIGRNAVEMSGEIYLLLVFCNLARHQCLLNDKSESMLFSAVASEILLKRFFYRYLHL